jgi:hypothetical protein
MLATQTEGKARRRGRHPAEASAEQAQAPGASHAQTPPVAAVLNGSAQGKFVLFNIPARDRREDGPVMRGFIEVQPASGEALKVNVAAWSRVSKEKRTAYLSLKVGNTEKPEADHADAEPVYTVGPFYGRLFREVTPLKEGVKVRYFGFVEDAQKVGEGEYVTQWQLAVRARRAVSNDGKTVYVSGSVAPAVGRDEHEDDLPF